MSEKTQYKNSILIFLIALVFYAGIGTAFQFSFKECSTFPTYHMLTKAFGEGKLDIQHDDITDVAVHDGKKYLYFGPLPAVIRLPLFLIFKQQMSTGWMISFYCSGVAAFFYLILWSLAQQQNREINFSLTALLVTSVLVLNGYSLVMPAIPVIHHEAVCSAMFFLMGSLYLFLRICACNFTHHYFHTILLGVFLSFTFLCRFSYIFVSTAIGIFFIGEYYKQYLKTMPHDMGRANILKKKIVLDVLILLFIAVLFLGLLLIYNNLRFGSPFYFGHKDIAAYANYFSKQNYFRYDHIPYNIWNFFFRIPNIITGLPFIQLPGYVFEVKSIYEFVPDSTYRLINTNELCASILILLPVSLIAFVPLIKIKSTGKDAYPSKYIMLTLLWCLQVLIIALTVATAVRYYYDFVPILLVCVFMGFMCLKTDGLISDKGIVCMGLFSIVISFAVVLNAIVFYSYFIRYHSPLLSYFFL